MKHFNTYNRGIPWVYLLSSASSISSTNKIKNKEKKCRLALMSEELKILKTVFAS